MRITILLCAGLVVSSAVAARPDVSPGSVTIALNARHHVEVGYELTGSPAVVTVEFQTNTLAHGAGDWVKLDGKVVRTVQGDVNCLVRTTGSHSFVWKAARDWSNQYIADGRFRAKLTVWPTNAPPTWLVCGLAKSEDVRYYADPDCVPGGLDNDIYKTDCLLMRKCPAAGVTWLMGSEDGESTLQTPGDEQRHNVMLTEDYYTAVYETTTRQYRHIVGDGTSDDKDKKPVLQLEFMGLRGSTYTDENTHEYCWPQDGHAVAPTSVIGKLRNLTGLDDFDLPTEAQWEYACRAGESYMFCNGTWAPRDVGLYSGDAASTGACHDVGERNPNNWGIYDMHGNVTEACLDHYSCDEDREATFAPDWKDGGVTVDPKGREDFMLNAGGVPLVVKRGGAWNMSWDHARAASAYAHGSWYYATDYNGFRLFRPAVAK